MNRENASILDKIISSQKAEEVANLDAVEIINNLFGELSERERDIIIRRYGLHGNEKETLEKIGQAHKLTRERIRQIETNSVKKLQQLDNLSAYIDNLRKVIFQLLEEHGGLVEKEYLLSLLTTYSLNGFSKKEQNETIHKNYLNFLITKLLHEEFEELINSPYFKESYKLKYQTIDHLEEIAQDLLQNIKKLRKIYRTEDIIKLLKKSEIYAKHESKLRANNNLDISRALKFNFFEENPEIVNSHKPLYSLLVAAKKIEQNKFGYWGVYNWSEIKPRTINDKIYLVMKNNGQPMHFSEIANRINEIGFDNKKANAATVHNELILDKKYVLIGRGIYSLKEWGYSDGTVSDVIVQILSEAKNSLERSEIIKEVLKKRMVKKATVILALMDRNKFKKKKDGTYSLV